MANWTVSIDDSSSFINYSPHGDGGVGPAINTGWQPWYSDQGFNTQGGELGTGDSQHITAFPNASLNFQFYGTEVELYGVAKCPYAISVDGNQSSFPGGMTGPLFHATGLDKEMHNLTLIAQASANSTFSFDRADITRPLPSGRIPTSQAFPATDTNFLKYSGNWTLTTDPNNQIPSKDHPAPYYLALGSPASLSFTFQGSGVAVNGSRNWGYYTYHVNLDGNTTSYNASTMWLIGDALLFYQDGLDPTAVHTLNLTPTVGGQFNFKFGVNSVTIFGSPNSTSTSGSPASSTTAGGGSPSPTSSLAHRSNVGGIVGGVIGAVAGLVIIAGALVYYFRRHHAAAATREPPIDPYDVADTATASAPTMEYVDSANLPSSSVGASPSPRLPSKLGAEQNANRAERAMASPMSDSLGGPQGQSSSSEYSAPSAPPATHSSPSAANSPESTAAVDRLVRIILDRIDHSRGLSDHGSSDIPDHPPPEYGA